ncbi:hypothetical protein GBA52_003898, partial [Prunus armeniaca]
RNLNKQSWHQRLFILGICHSTQQEQIYELFSRAGETKKIIMGLDKNTKTPLSFLFCL